jgi:hypothetical protein
MEVMVEKKKAKKKKNKTKVNDQKKLQQYILCWLIKDQAPNEKKQPTLWT